MGCQWQGRCVVDMSNAHDKEMIEIMYSIMKSLNRIANALEKEKSNEQKA